MAELAIDVRLTLGAFQLSFAERIALTGITALFGPSGSGKTSLLRVIAGLETTAQGTIAFGTEVWQDAKQTRPAHQRRIGYVFQDGRLFPHLTVRGNLEFGARHGRGSGRIGLDDAVAALALEQLLDRQPDSLSGGERQRVAIGRALLADPALLLLDEPLSSLDTERKREIVRYIESLPQRFDMPVIYVTHDLNELVRLAEQVVLLENGTVAGRGSVRDILEHHDLEVAAGLLDAGSVVEARIVTHAEHLTELAIGTETLRIPRIDAATGRQVRLRINARDIVLAAEQPGRISIRNVLDARIVSIDASRGAFVDVWLGIGDQKLKARITHEALEELQLEPDQSVFALIKSVALDAYPLL